LQFLLSKSKYYILIFLLILSRLNFSITEYSYTENFQILIILFSISIIVKYKNLIRDKYKSIFWLKIIFFAILLFEELSFLTEGFIEINDLFLTSEISLRHINLFSLFPLEGNIQNILKFQSKYIFQHLLQSSILIFLGYGSYFTNLKNYNLIFLDKTFSKFSFLVLVNLIIGFIITRIFYLEKTFIPIHPEYMELYIYFIFLLDLLLKIKKLKLNS